MNVFRLCRVTFLNLKNKYILEISQIGKTFKTVFFAIKIGLSQGLLNRLIFFPKKRYINF